MHDSNNLLRRRFSGMLASDLSEGLALVLDRVLLPRATQQRMGPLARHLLAGRAT